jgi:hypothetical protein
MSILQAELSQMQSTADLPGAAAPVNAGAFADAEISAKLTMQDFADTPAAAKKAT